jgi:group I intron endonuclease
MKEYFVYRIDDPITNQYYYGSHGTENFDKDDYMGSMITWNPEDKSRLIRTIIKRGFQNLDTAIEYESKLIEEHIDDELNENYYIPKKGFHVDGLRWKNSNETKNKKSDVRINKKLSKGNNNPMFGKFHTNSSKEKMRLSKLNKLLTERHKNNISNSLSGNNNPMYGKTHSTSSKQKMSENSKKRVGKYNTENKLLHIYNSINEASLSNNISISSISAVCNPKRINKTAGGFIWKLEN